MGQAAAASGFRLACSATTSSPLVNFTPRMSFGNWLRPSRRRQLFCAASTRPARARLNRPSLCWKMLYRSACSDVTSRHTVPFAACLFRALWLVPRTVPLISRYLVETRSGSETLFCRLLVVVAYAATAAGQKSITPLIGLIASAEQHLDEVVAAAGTPNGASIYPRPDESERARPKRAVRKVHLAASANSARQSAFRCLAEPSSNRERSCFGWASDEADYAT